MPCGFCVFCQLHHFKSGNTHEFQTVNTPSHIVRRVGGKITYECHISVLVLEDIQAE